MNCTNCGKPTKEIGRVPFYSAVNGKLIGYTVTSKCSKKFNWNPFSFCNYSIVGNEDSE